MANDIAANRIDYKNGDSTPKSGNLHDLLSEAQDPDVCRIIFVQPRDHYASCSTCQKHLKQNWCWPQYLFQSTLYDSNGYVQQTILDAGKDSECTIKHFRCLVKQVHIEEDIGIPRKIVYEWYEMTISVRQHCDGRTSIICYGVPKDFHNTFLEALVKAGEDEQWKIDGERVTAALLQDIVRLYDKSVWSIAKTIRRAEKERRKLEYDFEFMYELLRHAIHVAEVIEAAVGSFKELGENQSRDPTTKDVYASASKQHMHDYYLFCCRLLQNFVHRSKSNKDRLYNEIQLALNLVAQRDAAATIDLSHATLELSQAAQRDSAAMRTIAFVTLVFLPATFVATFFGMSFFNFQDGNPWSMTSKMWIFWAITIPLTAITIAAYIIRQPFVWDKIRKRWGRKEPDPEADPAAEGMDEVGFQLQNVQTGLDGQFSRSRTRTMTLRGLGIGERAKTMTFKPGETHQTT